MGRDTLDGRVNVGIVDDHPVVIEGIHTWLEADPRLRVVAAGDTIDVLELPAETTPDVLIIDLNLHGRVIVQEIAKLSDDGHRVVVFSQFSEQRMVLATLDAGAREFVAKHEGRTHLVDATLAIAADRTYITPTEAGALATDNRPERPLLSDRERTALLLWFHSNSKAAVARRMHISPHTVDMFIRRARLKYAAAGRSAHTKADLLARAIEDGLISPHEIAS